MSGLLDVINQMRQRADEIKRTRPEPQPLPNVPSLARQPDNFSYVGEAYRSLRRSPYDALGRISSTAGFVSGRPEFHQLAESFQQRGQDVFPSAPSQFPSMVDLTSGSASDVTRGVARHIASNIGQVPASMMGMMPLAVTAKAGLAYAGSKAAVSAPGILKAMDASPRLANFVNSIGGVENAMNLASNFVASTAQQAGGMSAEAYRETGIMADRSQIGPWAVLGGAVGSFHPTILQSVINKTGSQETIAEANRQFARYGVAGLIKVAQSMGLEFGVNYIQEIAQQASVEQSKTGDAGPTALMTTLGRDEAQSRAIAAGMSGAVGGGISRGLAEFMGSRNPAPAEPQVFTGRPTDDASPMLLEGPQPPAGPSGASGPSDVTPEFHAPVPYGQSDAELQAAIQRAKATVSKADVGDNTSVSDLQTISESKVLKNMMEALGVPENQHDQFAMEVAGKPIGLMTEQEIAQMKDTVASMLVESDQLEMTTPEAMSVYDPSRDVGVPEMPIADMPPQMTETAPQDQPVSLQDVIAGIRQPSAPDRGRMEITQPQMESVDDAEFKKLLEERLKFQEPSEATIEVAPEPTADPKPESLKDRLAELSKEIDRREKYEQTIVEMEQDGRYESDAETEQLRSDNLKALKKARKEYSKLDKEYQEEEKKEKKKIGTGKTIYVGSYELTPLREGNTVRLRQFQPESKKEVMLHVTDDGHLSKYGKPVEFKDPKAVARIEAKAMELLIADNKLEDYKTVIRPLQDELRDLVMLELEAQRDDAITQEQADHLFGTTPEQKKEREEKKSALEEKLKTGEGIKSLTDEELEQIGFDSEGFGKHKGKLFLHALDSKGKEREYTLKAWTTKKKGKITKEVIEGGWTKKQFYKDAADSETIREIFSKFPIKYHLEFQDELRTFLKSKKIVPEDAGVEEWRAFKDKPEALPLIKEFLLDEVKQETIDKARKAMQPDAEPEPTPEPEKPSGDVGVVGAVNIPELSKAVQPMVESFLDLEKPMDNRKLKKFMDELGIDIDDPNYSHKITQEAIEAATIRVIRDKQIHADTDQVLKLYLNQPRLNDKTADSVARQAYSTPAPLVSMITQALNLPDQKFSVFEPTAGNGLLLSGLPENKTGTKHDYFLNEITEVRLENLRELFPDADVTDKDGAEFLPDEEVDLVFTNPPFGALDKKITVYPIQGYERPIKLSKLEHQIAWNALKAKKPEGKGVIIVGAEKEEKISGSNKSFYSALYNQYEIDGHFEISGKLYERQGAAWPVAVIMVGKTKDFPEKLQAVPAAVTRAKTWDEVRSITDEIKQGVSRLGIDPSSDGRKTGGKSSGGGGRPTKSTRPGRQKDERPAGGVEPTTAEPGDGAELQPQDDSRTDPGSGRDTGGDIGDSQAKPREESTRPETDTTPTKKPDRPRRERDRGVESDFQTDYIPVSTVDSLNALVPKNLANPIREALKVNLKKSGHKTLDEFVSKELKLKSNEDLNSYLKAEQVDATALGITQYKNNQGFVVADETGVGKGRTGAASLVWGVENDRIGGFFTEKANLFKDFYRDMRDIGKGDWKPFIVNAKASMSYEDENGKTITVYKHDPKEYKRVMKNLRNGDWSDFGLGKKYQYIATTYSQFSDPKKQADKQQAFLTANNLHLILDESHNAAGAAKKTADGSNTMEFMIKLLDPEKTKSVTYMSATWAKTTNNLPLYFRAFAADKGTDLLLEAFSRGGNAMQEMLVSTMANNGAYIRREQSFEGVEWESIQTPVESELAKYQRETADKVMAVIRDLLKAEEEVGEVNQSFSAQDLFDAGVDIPPHLLEEQIEAVDDLEEGADMPTSPFSQVHNYVSTFTTALKADMVADRAIEIAKKGGKPVIFLQHTRESHMDLAMSMGMAKVGQPFAGTFNDALSVMTKKIRTAEITDPLEGTKHRFVIPSNLYPAHIQRMLDEMDKKIAAVDLSKLPFSPIDYFINKLNMAGISCGEISGRSKYLDYSEGTPILRVRKKPDRNDVVKNFNNGTFDAVIGNAAASTGWSGHSSEKFKDQRRRYTLLWQPFDNINTFVQALGRTKRTGAIVDPKKITSVIPGKPAEYGQPRYEYMQSALAMEIRPAVQLEQKMRSLNANTTSSGEGHRKIADVDMINKYGKEIMNRWILSEKPDVAVDLGREDKDLKAETITGRMAILDQETQNRFWDEVTKEYKEEINRLNAIGENELVIKSYDDANAKTVSKQIIHGTEGSLSDPPVYYEKVDMTVTGNPTDIEVAYNRIKDPVSESEIQERDKLFDEYIKRCEAHNAKRIKEEKAPTFNIPTMKIFADTVKGRLESHRPGTIMMAGQTAGSQMGVVEKIELMPLPKNYDANPWSPGAIKFTMSAPNAGGGVVISMAGLMREGWSKVGYLDKSKPFTQAWNQVSNNVRQSYLNRHSQHATRRITTEIITGDMFTSASMIKTSEVEPVLIGREDGTRDFAWLRKENFLEDLTLTKPMQMLTEEQVKDPPPEILSVDDKQNVRIGRWVDREVFDNRKNKFVRAKVVDRKPTTFQVQVRKTYNLSKNITTDPELRELLSTGTQDDVFVLKQIKVNNRQSNYFVTKDLPVSLKSKAVRIIRKILMDNNRYLHAPEPEIDRQIRVDRMSDARRGSAGIVNMISEYTADGILNLLESAYNYAAKGGRGFFDFIKSLAGKFRGVTASKLWRDANKLLKLSDTLGSRRGGVMRWSELVKRANERFKEFGPQPEIKQPIRETVKESYRAGKAAEGLNTQAVKQKLADLKKQNRDKRIISSQGKRFLIDLASKLPSKDQASLMRRIAEADTVNKQADVIVAIDKKYEAFLYRQAVSRLRKAIRAANKLHPDFQKIADELKEDYQNTAAMIRSIERINTYLKYRDDVLIDPKTIGAMGAILRDYPDKLSAETINMIAEALELIKHASDLEVEKMFADKTKTAEQAAKDILKHIESDPDYIAPGGPFGGFAKWYFDNGSLQWESLVERMGPVGHEIFHNELMRANREAKRLWFEGRDAVQNAMKDIGKPLDDQKTIDWLEEKTTIDTVHGSWEMTRNQKMNLVANLMDSDTAQEIIKAGAKLRGEDTYYFNEAFVALAIGSLDKDERVMVDAMRDFLHGSLAEEVNEMWVKLAGYEKALNPEYWPRTRDTETTGFNAGYRNYVMNSLEELGIFKERVMSKKAVVIGDVTQVYQWHIRKASSFAGMGEVVRNIEMLMGAGGLNAALEKKFGKDFPARLREQIEVVADLGRVAQDPMSQYLRMMVNNVAVAYLGLNPRSAVRQLGGLITAATEIPESLIKKHIGKAFDDEVRAEIYRHSPELRDRFESAAASLVESYYGDKDMVKPQARRKQVMALLRVFDRAPIQVIWQSCKDLVKQQKPELKGKAYWTAVADMAETITNRTQNVSSPLGMSGVAIRARMQPAFAAVNMFQSFGNSMFNNMRRQVRRFRNGEIGSLQFGKNMLYLSVGLAIFGALVAKVVSLKFLRDLVKDPAEEIQTWGMSLKQIGVETARNLARTLHGGDVAADLVSTINRISEGQSTLSRDISPRTPVGSIVVNATRSITSLARAAFSEGEFKSGPRAGKSRRVEHAKNAGIDAIRAFGGVKGAPLFPINEAVKIMR